MTRETVSSQNFGYIQQVFPLDPPLSSVKNVQALFVHGCVKKLIWDLRKDMLQKGCLMFCKYLIISLIC